MDVASSQVYANFRAWVPRNVIPVGTQKPQEWVFYDWGPRSYPEPLLCLHGVPGSSEMFFAQVTALAPRGYRVLSVEIAEYWTAAAFCDALHSFLETIGLSRVHLYGFGLGGFLAMSYLVRRPERVASIVLTHSWLTTDGLALGIRYPTSVLKWLPDFLVRAAVRDMMPNKSDGSTSFVTRVTMSSPRVLLATRLALAITKATVVGLHRIPEDRITLIDSMERSRERDIEISMETAKHLPGAKRAMLKSGGDFPNITVADEVNMHIIVHLRRNAPAPTEFPNVPPPALLPKAWQIENPASSSESVADAESEKTEAGTEEEEEEEQVQVLNNDLRF